MISTAQKTTVEIPLFVGPHLAKIIAGQNVSRHLVLCFEHVRRQIEKREFYPILSGPFRARGRTGRPLGAGARDDLLPMIVRAEIALYRLYPEHENAIREGMRALAAQVSRLAERDGIDDHGARLALADVNARAEILESVARIIDRRAWLEKRATETKAAAPASTGVADRGA